MLFSLSRSLLIMLKPMASKYLLRTTDTIKDECELLIFNSYLGSWKALCLDFQLNVVVSFLFFSSKNVVTNDFC